MKPTASSVKNATSKIREGYPKALLKCSGQALAYAQCLDVNDIHNVRSHACNEQFRQLKTCFENALKNVK